MKKLTEIDCENICNDYLLGLSYNLLSKKYNICTWSIGNVLKKNNIKSRIRKHNCNENYFKNKGMETTPKISKRKNIYTIQVTSKSDIELIKNILYTSCNDYYLKRKKEKFK